MPHDYQRARASRVSYAPMVSEIIIQYVPISHNTVFFTMYAVRCLSIELTWIMRVRGMHARGMRVVCGLCGKKQYASYSQNHRTSC